MFVSPKETIQKLAAEADIHFDGKRPWDITVHDERVYGRILSHGSLGLGEAYMDGWWDTERIDEVFDRFVSLHLEERIRTSDLFVLALKSFFLNLESKARSPKVAYEHYDLGNDLYTSFLDPYNQYTCGYFKNTNDLNVAQEQKLELICKKLQLKEGDRVLDIGCGWGGFAKYAAEHYQVSVTGITISKEQLAYAKEFTKGLPVELRLQDYRDLTGTFDKVLICGMIEHVGAKNYKKLMEVVHSVLADGGLFLLQTIGANWKLPSNDPWIAKYIFQTGKLPSIDELAKASERQFVIEDVHNFGADYEKTLLAWFKNFDSAWPTLREKYGDQFYRMWKYYLLQCAGLFRGRHVQLWQIVFSKGGVRGGYQSVR